MECCICRFQLRFKVRDLQQQGYGQSLVQGRAEEREQVYSGLEWSYNILKRLASEAVEQFQCLSVQVPGQGTAPSTQSSHCSPAAASVTVTSDLLDLVQCAVESAYELLLVCPDSTRRRAVLAEVEPLLGHMIRLTTATRGYTIAIYYKYKYHEYMAAASPDRSLRVQSLRDAVAVWEEMKAMGSFGSGNGVLDPYREGASVLAELGALLCSQGDMSAGYGHILNALHLVDEIWGATTPQEVPVYVQKSIALMSTNAGNCARDMGDPRSALEHFTTALARSEHLTVSGSPDVKDFLGAEISRLRKLLSRDEEGEEIADHDEAMMRNIPDEIEKGIAFIASNVSLATVSVSSVPQSQSGRVKYRRRRRRADGDGLTGMVGQ